MKCFGKLFQQQYISYLHSIITLIKKGDTSYVGSNLFFCTWMGVKTRCIRYI